MANQTITKTWETASGKTVTVTGKWIEQEERRTSLGDTQLFDVYKTTVSVAVEGIGNQGSAIDALPTPMVKDGIEYVARVNKLALTTEQMTIIEGVKAEVKAIKDANPVMVARREQSARDKAEYGDVADWDDIEAMHPWMAGTY